MSTTLLWAVVIFSDDNVPFALRFGLEDINTWTWDSDHAQLNYESDSTRVMQTRFGVDKTRSCLVASLPKETKRFSIYTGIHSHLSV